MESCCSLFQLEFSLLLLSLLLLSRAPTTQTREPESQQEDNRSYIKRPPNAFLLYVKEHRPHVEEDDKSAAVNKVLGLRWKSLSAEEQAIYYQQANREKELHAQRHPAASKMLCVISGIHLTGSCDGGLDLTESCGGTTSRSCHSTHQWTAVVQPPYTQTPVTVHSPTNQRMWSITR